MQAMQHPTLSKNAAEVSSSINTAVSSATYRKNGTCLLWKKRREKTAKDLLHDRNIVDIHRNGGAADRVSVRDAKLAEADLAAEMM